MVHLTQDIFETSVRPFLQAIVDGDPPPSTPTPLRVYGSSVRPLESAPADPPAGEWDEGQAVTYDVAGGVLTWYAEPGDGTITTDTMSRSHK